MDESNDKLLTVSQVCKLAGATVAQLKNWDKQGLLIARRTGEGVANNRKLYTMDDVRQAREILLYRKLGLGINQIKDILAAPEPERASLVAAHTSELKADYALIQRKIELSKALEMASPHALMDELDGITDVDTLVSAYEKDENLKQVLRWSRSHTERDIEQVSHELEDAFLGLAHLPRSVGWKAAELQIIHFCDVWSKSFGWPTVGQMLVLSEMFQELTMDERSSDRPFSVDLCEALSIIFLFAWATSTLKCFEDILANFYWTAVDDLSLECVQETAKVLRALVAESGCRPHLSSGVLSVKQTEKFVKMSDEAFDLLEEVALDESLDRYLHLDELCAIDGPALETARQLVEAHAEGDLERWFIEGGREQIERRIRKWVEALNLRFEWTLFGELGSGIKDWHEKTSDEEYARLFCSWIEDHYACTFADPPEARWASEEENCLVEKMTRAYVQQAEVERETTSFVLEVDE